MRDSPSQAQGLPVLCCGYFLLQQGPPCASVSLGRLLMAVSAEEGSSGDLGGSSCPLGEAEMPWAFEYGVRYT